MNVTVLGTGGWGLTLGQVLNDNGHKVSFWTFSQAEVDLLSTEHQYKDKLPGVIFPDSFTYTTDMNKALEGAELVLIVVPSQVMGNVCKTFAKWNPQGKIPTVVCATKGILEGTDQRMSEVILENVPWLDSDHVVTLSGPTHAEEVSRRVYTAIIAACPNEESAKQVQKIFSNDYIRIYTSTDQIGTELCGSVKNVIAIASGILYGIGAGDNTRAALITRGQAEICRLGRALGANPSTFAGLAGMGDLIVTCLSQHSRNRYVGECIGKGETLSQVMSHMKMIAEGVPTCKSAKALADSVHVELPIVNAVYEVLFNDKKPAEVIQELMNRDLKPEAEY
ncbi:MULTISPECIES: NAD(P)H-dependent glycerol-3-phosphate dehydrogenase [Hallerella]|uniref:NAD(P)H-dependent glycerol-3-phosphate dehydrogenase n=1 Tax=Hallerella TaxID=2815788 RepID=UPI000D0CF2C5|nr:MULTISPECIES: NAD(P)H-dependent glycerol-3-phosphate dehydrogenase [Hallerella]MCI6874501.1 NAD(P)-dependent glycerol-3-phosphate dehydrogenase [Hallerella sp.]MDY5029272.1 NAD(P)H-dependent glycerol-3-phosphate dehydrogenase [Hallerella succinigenes]